MERLFVSDLDTFRRCATAQQPEEDPTAAPTAVSNDAFSRRSGWLYADCRRSDDVSPASAPAPHQKLDEGEWEALLAMGKAICGHGNRWDEQLSPPLPDSIAIHGMRLRRRADARKAFTSPDVASPLEAVRSRIRNVASMPQQHGANQALMRALNRRINASGGPSGT